MDILKAGDHLRNVATGTTIQIIDTDATNKTTVATVSPDGRLLNKRRILSTSLRTTHLTKQGQPLKSGYVLVSALPDSPEAKPVTERKNMVDPTADDIDYSMLDDMELAAYINTAEVQEKAYKELAKKAKEEQARRTTKPGTRIFGDIAVNACANKRFDDTLAQKNLTPRQYQAICVTKADATLAKKILGEDSDAYRSALKDHGWRLTVRFATDEDRENAAAEEKRAALGVFQPGDTLDDKAPF